MIPIGSPQAQKIIQDDRRFQMVDDLHHHMEKALEIASELQFAGKDLANAFLEAYEYVDYDLTGFVAVIYEYAADNALMPEEYYTLKQLQYVIAQAVNTVNQEAAHE
jgi:hypothetical protein